MSDESLGDAAVETVDVTPEIDAEDFDFESFLAGARPTRRAVKIYRRADLVAAIEEAAGPLLQREDDDHRPLNAAEKKAAKEVARLREEFEASGVWFVAEARSRDWQTKTREEIAKRLGLDLGDDVPADEVTDAHREARYTVSLHMAAEQIAIPSGATAEGLRRLGQINEGELTKVLVAVYTANAQQAQAAGVLTRDFSPAPSAPARGSTKR